MTTTPQSNDAAAALRTSLDVLTTSGALQVHTVAHINGLGITTHPRDSAKMFEVLNHLAGLLAVAATAEKNVKASLQQLSAVAAQAITAAKSDPANTPATIVDSLQIVEGLAGTLADNSHSAADMMAELGLSPDALLSAAHAVATGADAP